MTFRPVWWYQQINKKQKQINKQKNSNTAKIWKKNHTLKYRGNFYATIGSTGIIYVRCQLRLCFVFVVIGREFSECEKFILGFPRWIIVGGWVNRWFLSNFEISDTYSNIRFACELPSKDRAFSGVADCGHKCGNHLQPGSSPLPSSSSSALQPWVGLGLLVGFITIFIIGWGC
jgi:hypothetical protein